MKKYPGIFLIVCLLAPYLGTYIFLEHEKKQVKRELKKRLVEGIDKKELVLLEFSRPGAAEALNWEHAGEFEYMGEMYDVISSEMSSDSVRYWCWWDNEETLLNRQLSSLVEVAFGNSPAKKESERKLLDFSKSLSCQELLKWKPSDFLTGNCTIIYHFSKYICFSKNPPGPPPEKA